MVVLMELRHLDAALTKARPLSITLITARRPKVSGHVHVLNSYPDPEQNSLDTPDPLTTHLAHLTHLTQL